jgi:antitoxin component YwqK of YwqJK toxin-antitoxin module
MCKFYSVVSDGKGRVEGFEAYEVREMIEKKEKRNFNSHTFLCEKKNIKEDKWNKWEYEPISKKLEQDTLVTDDDRLWVQDYLDKKFKGMTEDRILEMGELFNKVISRYKKGKREGERIGYYNGNISYKDNWKNGKLEGERIEYYNSGNIYHKDNWKNGILEGERIEYYDNGNISCKEDWKNGKREGERIEYYDNGNIYYKEDWKNGKREGERIGYYNGNISCKDNYKNGKLVE